MDGAVFPASNGMAAGLGEVPKALGDSCREGRVTKGSALPWEASFGVRRKGGGWPFHSPTVMQLGVGAESAVLDWRPVQYALRDPAWQGGWTR